MEGSTRYDLRKQLQEREAEARDLREKLEQADGEMAGLHEEIDRLRQENEQLRRELQAAGRGSKRGKNSRKPKAAPPNGRAASLEKAPSLSARPQRIQRVLSRP